MHRHAFTPFPHTHRFVTSRHMPLSNNRLLLPNELILQILLLLDHNDFRNVSNVSRQLRGLSIAQPEYFFTCRLMINLDKSEHDNNKVMRFVTKLREMTASGQQIVLEAEVNYPRRGGREDLDHWRIALQAISEALFSKAKIVEIYFELVRTLWTNELLVMAMDNPALWLRRLKLIALPRYSAEDSVELPAIFFHGTAPRLKDVVLHNVHIGQPDDEIEVFREVSKVTLFAPATRDILRVEKMFPNAREIYMLNIDPFDLVDLTAGQGHTRTRERPIESSLVRVLRLGVRSTGEHLRCNLGLLVSLVAPRARNVEMDIAWNDSNLQLSAGLSDDLLVSVFGDGAMVSVSICRHNYGVYYTVTESENMSVLRICFNNDYGYGYENDDDYYYFPGTIAALEGLQRHICGIRMSSADIDEFNSVWDSLEKLKRIEVDITYGPELGYGPKPAVTTPEGGRDDPHQYRMTGRPMQRELVLAYRDNDPLAFSASNVVSIASRLGLLEHGSTVVLSLRNIFLDPADATDLPDSVTLLVI